MQFYHFVSGPNKIVFEEKKTTPENIGKLIKM